MTETQTVDLAAWLTAIWDEEEQAMKRVGNRVWFVCDDGHFEQPVVDDDPWEGTGEYERWDDGDYRLPNHHNTWLPAFDPAAVLARIAADRKILEHCAHAAAQCPEGEWPDGDMSWAPLADQARHIMRLLASPYKGREGWQEEWDE